jgi:hypothetical protein
VQASLAVLVKLVFLGENDTVQRMSVFDRIRPYHDHEVPEVVDRIVNHPDLPRAAAKILMPALLRDSGLGGWLSRCMVRHKTRALSSISDCQLLIAEYFKDLIAATIHSLTTSGLEDLDPNLPYLFTSNHRDIVLDSSLMNFLLHQAGYPTCRMAIGDNLLEHQLAADLMKLNKSFVVERDVAGTRAAYKNLVRTSQYIRQSIEEGVSVWIAQREGRAKDGWDRTDPALLKMLALAHKDEGTSGDGFDNMSARYTIVPVSVAYELDPCAGMKAHELFLTDRDGRYDKKPDEDLLSIVTGLIGQKGRVHIHFGKPLGNEFDTPQTLAEVIDTSVLGNMRVFPTQVHAADLLHDEDIEAPSVPPLGEIMALFDAALATCPEVEQPYVLLQYANLIRNRRAVLNLSEPG